MLLYCEQGRKEFVFHCFVIELNLLVWKRDDEICYFVALKMLLFY